MQDVPQQLSPEGVSPAEAGDICCAEYERARRQGPQRHPEPGDKGLGAVPEEYLREEHGKIAKAHIYQHGEHDMPHIVVHIAVEPNGEKAAPIAVGNGEQYGEYRQRHGPELFREPPCRYAGEEEDEGIEDKAQGHGEEQGGFILLERVQGV